MQSFARTLIQLDSLPRAVKGVSSTSAFASSRVGSRNYNSSQRSFSKQSNVNSVTTSGSSRNPRLSNYRLAPQSLVGGRAYYAKLAKKGTPNFDDAIALCKAAREGDVESLKKLLESGVDVNAGDYDGRTALHVAAAEAQVEIVKALIATGKADVNAADRFGNTPAHDALRFYSVKHQEILKLLEESGGNLSHDLWRIRNTQEFRSALQKSLPLLLERGRWDYTEVWIPNADESALVPSNWYAEKPLTNEVTTLWKTVQETLVHSKETFYGKAWETKKAVWTDDISKENLPQAKPLANGSSFQSALGLPIVYNDKVLAVLGFFSTEKRPHDPSLVDKFYQFSSGMIKAGIDQALSGSPDIGERPLAGEQMGVVYNTILEEGVFNGTVIYQELDWWYNSLGLQAYYFERFSPFTISRHLHSFIAAKKLALATGQPENIRLSMQQKDGGGAFYLCPSDHESVTRVESKIEKLVETLPEDKAYTLTFFRSKGTAIPNGSKHLGLYIFDVADYVEKNVPETETDIWKIATGVFLRDKTPLIRDRYQEVIKKSVNNLYPSLEIFPTYRDGTTPLMFAFKMGGNTSYLSTLTELLKFNNLTCERKFIETFSNGMVVYSLYLHPCEKEKIQDLLDQVSLLHLVPKSNLTEVFLHSGCTAEEYAYASVVSKCVYYFLSKPSEEFKMLAETFKDDPLNKGRLTSLQTSLRRDAITRDRISQCLMNYPTLWDKLFDNFKKITTTAEKPAFDEELSNEIKQSVANEADETILLGILTFNYHVLKTNFFKRSKSALSFRLDPAFMADMNFPEVPYGLYFLMGLDFQGFHVRFRDVSRGGIRIIGSSSEQVYNRNVESQFNETYNLSYTQNKKNKDIPEFGSKGTVLLNWGPLSQKNKMLSFQKYVAGLMDLIVPKPEDKIIDHYGKEELLFLGPDEGSADFMRWAAEYSQKRDYPFWLSLTTGKPPSMGGVPHDTYGMTTRSVRRYVEGTLAKVGLRQEDVTKLQTGGPDGDLGSNEILKSTDKTIGVIDGSGVLYDPNGLNREELVRLAKRRVMINEFDTSLLGPGGFRVLVSDKGIQLPNGDHVDSGFTFRNEFHLNPLVEADLFVPCGGRPESVNLKNVHRMFKKDGSPRFKYVIEGANLFLTPDARMVLEQAGVILYKDASTNKGGVTSSSLEVLAALAMTTEQHQEHMQVKDKNNPPKFYQQYVEEIQETIQENADLEFECIWREHELTKTPRNVLTDRVSDKINYFNDVIQSSNLWDDIPLRRRVMNEAFPNTLIDKLGLDTLLKTVPENYSKAIFGAYLASRYVYKFGLSAPEFAFFEFMQPYLGE